MNRYIANVDRFNLATGASLVVWLTPEGREKFQVENAYEISSECGCANIKWESSKFGEQHIQYSPGGSEDQRVLEYYLENPESAIDDIIRKNEELEEEKAFAAATKISDIRRGLIDNTPAVLFKVAGDENCEWLDDENHMLLANSDRHLDTNWTGGEEARDSIVEQLEEWLSENPITVEWTENNERKVHVSSINGGTFDTLAEAEEELENFKKELLAQCATDEDRQKIENGKISISW